MRTPRGSIKLLLAIALWAVGPLQAKVLTAKIARVSSGAGSMQGVQVTLDWPEGASAGQLRIRAQQVDFPALSYRATDVDWQCDLMRPTGNGWDCDGLVSVRGSRRQKLDLALSPEGIAVALGVGASSIKYRNSPSQPGLSSVNLQKVPVAWLERYLAGLWPSGKWTGGRMDGTVAVDTARPGAVHVRTDLDISGLGVETPDGLLAAAALKGRLRLDYRQVSGVTNVDSRITLRGGELLFQSFYAKLPASAIEVQVRAARRGAAPWSIPFMEWRDPGVLTAVGNLSLDKASSVKDLDLSVAMVDLAIARERYLSGFLSPAGFSNVLLTGTAEADLQMRDGEFSRVATRLDRVNAVDPTARFTFAGIDGRLGWTSGSTPVTGQIGWNSGALFGIGMGSARFPLTSAMGQVKLDRATSVESLGGRLVLDHLRWQAPSKGKGATVVFGLGMDSMDLASLSQRLGWPAFAGTISGKIPSARLENDALSTDGGLQMDVFGGTINMQNLSMERPFGVAPTLSADVRLADIDLEPLTRVFGFGAITGRLDGRLDSLRLVDWSAEAFDARFETDKAWKGRRRISQRAVKDISTIGGGGLSGGLQARALKLFDDFSYERIGIGCSLRDGVCTMDGIGSAGEGYIIVEGAGLPRIQVVGFRRQVDWSTLVSRLQAATRGQAPIVQ